MRVLVLVGAVLVATSALAQTPTVQLIPSKPTITISLTSVPVGQAIEAIASDAGIVAEFAPDIPVEDLDRELTARFTNARIKDVLSFLANSYGLTYRVIDAKTVRFEKKR
jgi:hypothetical protein